MPHTGPNDAASPRLLNTIEAARLLRVHVNTVKALCRKGRLPATKIGREWRINRADLLAYLQAPADLAAAHDELRALSERARQAEALLRAAQRLNSQLTLDAALAAVCEEARLTLGLPAAWINLYDPERDVLIFAVTDGMPPTFGQRYRSPPRALLEEQKRRAGNLIVFPDVRVLTQIPNAQLYADMDIRTIANAVMVQQGQLIGVLSAVTFGEIRYLNSAELALLEGLANQAALAIANARLFDGLERELAERKRAEQALLASREQLQTLSRRLVEVQEEERKSLSRELHDETGQVMTALKLGLGMLRRDAACTEEMAAAIDNLCTIAEEAAESLHRLALNLRPASLDRYGLVPALQGYIAAFGKQTSIRLELVLPAGPQERLPANMESALYRIVQEALTNVARHAQAIRASVMFQRREHTVVVLVEDDGMGFDVEEAFRKGRLGLLGMRERAAMLGGQLTIESEPGNGTTLIVEVPLDASTQ
jgi:excisionase family DNA binding protein